MSTCRLLRWKQDNDPAFVNFLSKKRGAARHTLESLMLLPVTVCCLYPCTKCDSLTRAHTNTHTHAHTLRHNPRVFY